MTRRNTLTGFYYPDELEFQDNSDLTETNNQRVGERGNSQEEAVDIFLYILGGGKGEGVYDCQRC